MSLWARCAWDRFRTSDLSVWFESKPVAFAEPGELGRLVVSTGALADLDEGERRALFAHEHAHLRNAHHRFPLLAQASVIALPLLYPLLGVARFLLERWADEDAARAAAERSSLRRWLDSRSVPPLPARASGSHRWASPAVFESW